MTGNGRPGDARPGDARPGDGIRAGGGRLGDGGIPAVDSLAGLADLDGLRELVRQVLREVLPAAADQPNPLNVTSTGSEPAERHIHRVPGRAVAAIGSPAGGPASPGSISGPASIDGTVRAVRLSTDEELHAFVTDVLRLAGDSRRRQDMLAGRLRFTLAVPAGGRPPGPAGHPPPGPVPSGGVPAGHLPGGVPAGHLPPGPVPSGGVPAGHLPGGVPAGHLPAGHLPGGVPVGHVPSQFPPAERRVEKGAVTERAVIATARAGERLVLGPRAVLTPLARDKARALGVLVEKER